MLADEITYTKFGHNSFKKLVCMYPGSRQPTVLAGAPAHRHSYDVLSTKEKLSKWKNIEHLNPCL